MVADLRANTAATLYCFIRRSVMPDGKLDRTLPLLSDTHGSRLQGDLRESLLSLVNAPDQADALDHEGLREPKVMENLATLTGSSVER